MNYRGIEFYVAQGVEVGTWKFTTSMNDQIRLVRATNRQEAAEVIERRIEAALSPRRSFAKGVGTVVFPHSNPRPRAGEGVKAASSSHFAYLPESCGVMSGYAPGVFSLASSCIWRRVLRAQLRLRSSLTLNFSRPSPSVSSSIVSPSMNGLRPR